MNINPIAVGMKEAGRISGFGRTFLYAAISRGELASARIGRRRVIRLVDLDTWIGTRVDRRVDGANVR
ncbi:MAG: helix-turn-helix domain-containing protein [Reyranellaceae bacterium]